MKSYIAVGLGGSGSRLLGEIFHILHFEMGSRLNDAYDNLDTFAASNYYHNMSPFNKNNYPRFKRLFIKQIKSSYSRDTIVIKEPNYHLYLPFLKKISEETEILFHLENLSKNILNYYLIKLLVPFIQM